MRLPVNRKLPLAAPLIPGLVLGLLLGGCGGSSRAEPVTTLPANGPGADYPMVLGAPFVIDGVTWTPADTMNSDSVGRAALGQDGGAAVTAAHRTLPLPSYVEVTELNTGKTVLVRLERRGPMTNSRLIALSPGAAAQLGITADGAPVRVRRVNPPEPERALLRSGQPASPRMDTPKSLLAVLNRKLEGAKPILQPLPAEVAPIPAPSASPTAEPSKAAPPKVVTRPGPTPSPAPVAAATPAPTGSLMIQAGAFSSKDRADAMAAKIGGQVSRSGNLWRVRKGPFSNRADANAALAQVRGAGYSDARIQSAN